MRVARPLVFLVCFLSTSVHSDEIHPSTQFKEKLSSCLPSGKKDDNCLLDTVLEFTENEDLRKKLRTVIDGAFNQIIDDREVFAVHPVLQKKLGDFFVEESIMIESDTGGLSLLRVTFARALGVWQIRNVAFSTEEETIEKALDINI